MRQHDVEWLRVEDHVRGRGAEALRPGTRAVAAAAGGGGGGRAQGVAAREGGSKRLRTFARVLQDIEDGCLGCVRRVLAVAGRGLALYNPRELAGESVWQQDGML